NTWQVNRISSTLPGTSFQLAGGRHFKIKKNELGLIASLSHNNSYRNNQVERRDYISPKDDNIRRYNYIDSLYKHEVLMGGMLNLAFKTEKSKFSFKNIVTVNSEDQVSYRTGVYEEDPEYKTNVRNTALLFSQNNLYSSQLTGDHLLKNDIKIHWVGSYNKIYRQVPDFRKQAYSQTIDKNIESEIPYSARVGYGGADINQSGRFFSELNENLYSGSFDVSMPVLKKLQSIETTVKTGGYLSMRNRDFAARSFGYVQNFGLNPKVLSYGLDSIFSHNNISEKLYIKEDTRPSDSYKAGSDLKAAYLMADNKFGKNIRLVWGVRAENYRQQLIALDASGKEVKVDTTVLDILPSANVSLSLSSKSNLRFCASKTVSRPEFREIAPFAFYDFNLDAVVSGNPTLQRSTIQNFDIRYEFFPGGSQIISASVFYKKFTDAVEMINEPVGAGSRTFGYQNAPNATNYGVELEFRKNLTFMDTLLHTNFLSNVSVFSNVSYIKSEVDLTKFKEASNGMRPLQGQSPYIINAGFSYASAKGLSVSLLANRIGRRIAYVGNKDVPDIWENPRTVVDFQIAQKFYKKLDVKIAFGDVLAQNLIFYQDLNSNGKYDTDETANPDKDNAIYNYKYGRNISLGLSYKF
ncbi:MAG: TonB-dependent receptor domain-containing protein, partial [Bacteroidia bacterium]